MINMNQSPMQLRRLRIRLQGVIDQIDRKLQGREEEVQVRKFLVDRFTFDRIGNQRGDKRLLMEAVIERLADLQMKDLLRGIGLVAPGPYNKGIGFRIDSDTKQLLETKTKQFNINGNELVRAVIALELEQKSGKRMD